VSYKVICGDCAEPWGTGHNAACREPSPMVLPRSDRLLRDGETPPAFGELEGRTRQAAREARAKVLEARAWHEQVPNCPLRTRGLRLLTEALAKLEQLEHVYNGASVVVRPFPRLGEGGT
jgi:hypothetical protein